ncbi:hypothetical protein [Nostoc sp. LEGE 12450]|uniref:hypothetical protein n=1 Tax=Nostoc sp. LEGE 12450 TaxID=1828643 RepID=UPI001D15039A|nr:hypothetical protein [Nostoc sp. LEGE 12450]
MTEQKLKRPMIFIAKIKPLRRVSLLACTIAAATLGIDFSFASQASNAEILPALICQGAQTSSYSPNITNEKKTTTIDVEGVLTSCVYLLPIFPNSGTLTRIGTYSTTIPSIQASCNDLLPPFNPSDLTYKWSNNQSSTVRFVSGLINVVGGQTIIESNGIVTSGEFKNYAVRRTIALVAPNPTSCSDGVGVSKTTGTITLVFSKVGI